MYQYEWEIPSEYKGLRESAYNWATSLDFQQSGMCNQQRLRSACALCAVQSEPLLVAWIFYECSATDWKSFGVSKLKRRLHRWLRLVWVYTCQNATLFEITCRGSYLSNVSSCRWNLNRNINSSNIPFLLTSLEKHTYRLHQISN